MTLVLRPPGRGNWAPLIVRIEGKRFAPMAENVRPGMFFTLGSRTYRIAEVRA